MNTDKGLLEKLNNEQYVLDIIKNDKEYSSDVYYLIKNDTDFCSFFKDNSANQILQLISIPFFNSFILKYINNDLKSNKEVVLEAVKRNGYISKYRNSKLDDDEEIYIETTNSKTFFDTKLTDEIVILLEAIKNDVSALSLFNDKIRDNKRIILEAIDINGLVLEYASDRLKNDKIVVLNAVKNNIDSFKFMSEQLKNDTNFLLALVEKNSFMNHQYIKFITNQKLDDDNIKEEYKDKNKMDQINLKLLQYINDKINNDKSFELSVYQVDPYLIQYINDKNFVLMLLNNNPELWGYINSELQKDKDIKAIAFKKNKKIKEFKIVAIIVVLIIIGIVIAILSENFPNAKDTLDTLGAILIIVIVAVIIIGYIYSKKIHKLETSDKSIKYFMNKNSYESIPVECIKIVDLGFLKNVSIYPSPVINKIEGNERLKYIIDLSNDLDFELIMGYIVHYLDYIGAGNHLTKYGIEIVNDDVSDLPENTIEITKTDKVKVNNSPKSMLKEEELFNDIISSVIIYEKFFVIELKYKLKLCDSINISFDYNINIINVWT